MSEDKGNILKEARRKNTHYAQPHSKRQTKIKRTLGIFSCHNGNQNYILKQLRKNNWQSKVEYLEKPLCKESTLKIVFCLFLAWLCGVRALCSQTGIKPGPSAVKAPSPNY